jgi:hypothetical protein
MLESLISTPHWDQHPGRPPFFQKDLPSREIPFRAWYYAFTGGQRASSLFHNYKVVSSMVLTKG